MPYTSSSQLDQMKQNVQSPTGQVTLSSSPLFAGGINAASKGTGAASIFNTPVATGSQNTIRSRGGTPVAAAPSQKLPGTQSTVAAPSQKLPASSGYNSALTTAAVPSAHLSVSQPGAAVPQTKPPGYQSALTAATNAVVGAANNTVGAANNMMSGVGPGPANPAPTLNSVLGSSPLTQAQWNNSTSLGQGIQQQGQNVLAGQQAQANSFNRIGQGFDATSQNVAARPTGFIDPRTGQQQMTPGFNVGAQVPTTGGTAAPKALSTSQLGGAPSIGQIGQVAGQLGGAPQAAGVGGIAGRLGAAPSVGNAGNIQMAAGPGAVMPQLGNMGQQNAAQGEMLSRLSGFLDSGNGPSMAEAQLQQSQADNMANLIGAARSGRGGAGAQAQALRGAMSEGSAIMSDTAGQLATLRAQEADMQKNRQLSAIGLGGQMSEAQRAGDLGFRGQDLAALQGDQGAALQGRGQDLQAAMANQGTQTQLEQLRASTALGARGQNLSALQGDQGTAAQMSLGNLQAALGARGQDLSALQGDQSTALGREGLQAQTALGARGQDLSLLQGNQATALGARGQDVTRDLGMANVNLGMRGQDAGVLMGDADRNLAAQRLGLDAGLGYGSLANDATGQGLQFMGQANQQGVMSQGLANDAAQNFMNNMTQINNANVMADAGIQQQILQNAGQPGFGESLAIAGMQSAPQVLGPLSTIFSDERAKTDISPLDSLAEHLRASPGYSYRYREGFGEDTETEHAGPMAGDLERSPFGRSIVKRGPGGYKVVDTARLALVDHAALASMRSELDELRAKLDEPPAPMRWKRTDRAKRRMHLEG